LQVLVVEVQALESRLVDSLLDQKRRQERVHATSVAEARARLAERTFDLVVTDESRLRAVLDGLFAFVGVFSLDGVVVDVNRAPLATGNLKISDVVGHRFVDLPWWSHSTVERARVVDALARAAGGERLRFVTNVRRMTGDIMYVDASFAPLRDASGAVTHVLGSGVDVTTRHLAEEALARSEARLAEAQRVAHIGSWEWDVAKNALTWSDELFAVYGIAKADFRGNYEAFLSRVYPADLERTKSVIGEALRNGTAFVFEHRIVRPDGAVRMLQTRGQVSAAADGRPLRMVGACWDTTEIWESRQQLRALAARLDAIREDERRSLSREIHDRVGQDLTALKLELDCLREQLPAADPEVARRLARLEALVDGTLGTTRRVAAELRPILLDDLGLGAAIEEQAREFEARTGVPCRVSVPASLPALDASVALALFRILQEGLTNVARHAGAQHVTVTLTADGTEIGLTVEDDGRGITPEEVARPGALGLLGTRERALVVGGTVTVARRKAAGGTILTARVPWPPTR
jgi:PAS domain S-box-containing protein